MSSVPFVNKDIDATNLANILHHKNENNKIPLYFKDKSIPIISYFYISPIASKLFKYKRLLPNHQTSRVTTWLFLQKLCINCNYNLKGLMNTVEDYARNE